MIITAFYYDYDVDFNDQGVGAETYEDADILIAHDDINKVLLKLAEHQQSHENAEYILKFWRDGDEFMQIVINCDVNKCIDNISKEIRENFH